MSSIVLAPSAMANSLLTLGFIIISIFGRSKSLAPVLSKTRNPVGRAPDNRRVDASCLWLTHSVPIFSVPSQASEWHAHLSVRADHPPS